MEHHLSGTPVPDPFLAAVRRRHPDVDVVVLPPEPPLEPPSEPPSEPGAPGDDRVAVALLRLGALARDLTASLGVVDLEPRAEPTYGDRESEVRAVVRLTARRDDGHDVLGRLGAMLQQRGWEVTRPPGWVERVSATHDDLALRATAAAAPPEGSGAFALTLTSASIPVGLDRARRIVRGAR